MGTIARERKRISVIGNVIREFSSLLELGEETSMEGNKGINVSTVICMIATDVLTNVIFP